MSRMTRFLLLSIALIGFLTGSLAAEEPFDYFRNSWNVIGLKDYDRGARITPENRLLLADGHVEFRFGSQLVPLSRKQVKTLHDGWMPIVLLTASDGPIRYDLKFWSTPLPTVKDWQKAFDSPTEGENFLNFVHVVITNTSDQPAEAKFQAVESGKSAKINQVQAISLAPNATAKLTFQIPFARDANATPIVNADPKLWLDRTIDYWENLVGAASRIEVPCRKSTEALLAAHVCQLIAADHGELHGGEGFYDQFYLRDAAYQIMELEEAGLDDAAEKAVEHYLRRQRSDGRFETQKNQYDANGQTLWVLWQYYKITGDADWLEKKAYPQMRRAVDWMLEVRRDVPADSPFAGLLPAAPADGEYLWDGKHHILGYDFWNLRGLILTADAADVLGKTEEAATLRKEADAYRKAIDAAWKRLDVEHFPPSWEKDGTHWGNTETIWPTPIFDDNDPRVAATIHHARCVHGDGFIEGTIQWLGGSAAIHPYMSAYTTMASLRRGEHEAVVEDFYWYLLHSTAAHAFPEGVFQQRRFAWSNTIPHVTGASNYALMLRHMLLDERDDELHLLPAVPDGWIAPGQTIRITDAPTHFGRMSLSVHGTADGVRLEMERPKRNPPKRTVLYLPKSRPLIGTLEGVEVIVREDQKVRWDFPTVVKRYQETSPLARPIPDVVSPPWNPAPKRDACRPVDISAVTNTDPLTAPFGVPNFGKFLFTGLKTGRQTFAGVPFDVIDSTKNEGTGFVVLHSSRAPKNRKWPVEVEIPVRAKGRRLFFLGNVHGWQSQDPGKGPWGAVAEYVIHYTDGQRQTVPLITGRTIDEWALPPEAENVAVAASGDPWHLNILCVTLRDAVIEKVVFRDLGTPAAPVLAGITLEP